jgi:N-acetylmuramoyl-L-alanine amidase
MRRPAATPFVLAIAASLASSVTALGSPVRALAAGQPPAPVVIAIDPGHGGTPDPNDPTQPSDPGAIGTNGVLEKDVALDTAKRVAALLQQQLVQPVLTRSTDVWMTIAAREQVAVNAHAALFVSIHCNSFTSPTARGSLVLYPNAMGQPFAQALSDALATGLRPDGVPDDGIQLRDDWWIHAPMPTSTVEMAYLSNPPEAALMATESFREAVAESIVAGMEHFDPQIERTKAAIQAWEAVHGATPPPAPSPAQGVAAARPPSSGGVPGVVPWLLLLIAAAAALRYRRRLVPLLDAAFDALPLNRRALHRAMARRRRRRLRSQSLVHRVQPATQHRSVYDDLSF